MNEKCSLSNLNMYLRVTGLLSLIIILIIVVYYYLQSNRSKILEKYESYALRDCKVYFTEGDTNIKNCDITQETSNYTGSCSYRFDGWNEFDTYTDNDGKTITYPKKVYTQTRTNTNDFNNPMFTNNCFKAYTDETCIPGQPNDNCIPPEFEYNANNVVRYDEPGTSGNTAVGTNIYGGLRYSSMQFLNTADPIYNNTNLISSICDVPLTNTLGSLNKKVFYKFEFNATTNKLENITSVSLNSDQTTFSPLSSDNVLTNLPPRPTDASFYGLQYDATNRNLPIKIFKKNNIPRNVAVFKFNYMSYICIQSQIKNYMMANRIITPEKFIKYGSSTTPNYSKNISISNNMIIKKDWKWSNYSSTDFNQDYSYMLNSDLNTSIYERKAEIDLSYAGDLATAEENYNTALGNYNSANSNSSNFSTNYQYLYNKTDLDKSVIGIKKQNYNTKMFNYTSGYNISPIKNNFTTGSITSTPVSTKSENTGAYTYMKFTYTGDNTGSGQTEYTITPSQGGVICDILLVGGGGGGGDGGGGGGGFVYLSDLNIPAGSYKIRVGKGGNGGSALSQGSQGSSSSIIGGSINNIAYGGGGGGGTGTTAPAHTTGQVGSYGGNGADRVVTQTYSSSQGNRGGSAIVPSYGSGGGGGGAGGAGGDANINVPNVTAGNGSVYYRGGMGGDGKASDITGTTLYYAGGGTGGANTNSGTDTSSQTAPGGGGGRGSRSPNGIGENGIDDTGGGGGGGDPERTTLSGRGGTGVVIIRYKNINSITISSFQHLDTAINKFYSNEPSSISKISMLETDIQSKVLTSFIFLQRGYYYFSAGVSGGGYNSNMMISSDLLIFDELNFNGSLYNNARVVYKNIKNDPKYFNKYIYIPNSKFYKLAYRYTIYNTNNSKIDADFNIYCKYQDINTNLSFDKYTTLNDANIQADNNGANFSNINDSSIFNIRLTDYLFCGGNLYNNYYYKDNNGKYSIMNLFSNVKYIGNDNSDYASIITYLNDIDFFNIKKFYDDLKSSTYYKDVTLPTIISNTKRDDAAIINMQGIIGNIDRLKGANVNVNYSSQLPTTSPSLYKDITIDEIFGKNFDRLITKERVNPTNPPTEIPTKKIYVEAVAA